METFPQTGEVVSVEILAVVQVARCGLICALFDPLRPGFPGRCATRSDQQDSERRRVQIQAGPRSERILSSGIARTISLGSCSRRDALVSEYPRPVFLGFRGDRTSGKLRLFTRWNHNPKAAEASTRSRRSCAENDLVYRRAYRRGDCDVDCPRRNHQELCVRLMGVGVTQLIAFVH